MRLPSSETKHDGLRGLAYMEKWRMERIGKMDKNDRKYEQFASVSHLINGYGEWVQSLFDDGFRMYLVTFKFNQIPGSSEYKWREMLKQVEYQFYPTLIKRVERQPMKPKRQRYLPRLIAVPDVPVAKHSKKLSVKSDAKSVAWQQSRGHAIHHLL
jgi:hypothetical protein